MAKEEDECEWAIIVGALIVGIFIGAIAMGFIFDSARHDIGINQETADDICVQLTGNESAIADTDYRDDLSGKLICKIPSFDATHNIIVIENNKEVGK